MVDRIGKPGIFRQCFIMIVKGKNVFLRYPEISDSDLMLTWENDPEVWEAGENKKPYSLQDIRDFILDGQDLYLRLQSRLMICLNGDKRPIGCIDLFEYSEEHQRAGVGILIYKKGDRRLGHATEALNLLINFSRDHIKMHQLYCHILKDNQSSIGLFKKVGFETIGLKKAWRKSDQTFMDEYMFQLLLN